MVVAGLLLLAFAVVNVDSIVTRGPLQEEHDAFSGFSSQTVTWNLLPVIMIIAGFGLVAVAVWMRLGKGRD
jgi:hypothetical protein